MGQVVVWGNGDTVTGRFKVPANKTAINASANPQSGGVRVDWGGGDVDILEGETWTLSANRSTQWFVLRKDLIVGPQIRYGWWRVGNSGAMFSAVQNAKNPCNTPPVCGDPAIPTRPTGINANSGGKPFVFSLFGPQTRTYCGQCSIITHGYQTYYDGQPVEYASPGQYRTISVSVSRHSSADCTWTVETDTGDASSRTQTDAPNISSENSPCKIRINYSDQSDQEIILSNCADWARLEDDSQCPPGSCPCDHRDYRCCIGSNGQVIKKIRL
ncbi:hypothetical protein [Picosynechococcus sp. PCC 8807]|uniref:hypothetical protein n=1 Tax=Picosynechococcus sp. PCC 8807 TaxID=195248 RepID=UPI0018DD3B1C|nr:hypothetical protein [Picosynechococcus sp. PCC 8807]